MTTIFSFIFFLLVSSSYIVSATIPILRAFREDRRAFRGDQPRHKGFHTLYYRQTLDHFNYQSQSYTTFNQKYIVNSNHWAGANSGAPIFAFLGAESQLYSDFPIVDFLSENAPHFKALVVYLEHRFYGDSIPSGLKLKEAIKNNSLRGYFNSAQALADYAELSLHLKKKFSSESSPIIVFGGSYGGMLASWFRLKYPHVALGALASSAPLLYFDDLTPQNGYYSVVTKDFRDYSQSCEQIIRASWDEIDRYGSNPNGLSILSKKFRTCKKLKNISELKDYLEIFYRISAQYDWPPSNIFCDGVDRAPKGSDILDRIMSGIKHSRGNTCCDIESVNQPSQTDIGFTWQICSEMVFPIGRGVNDTMFQARPFNITSFTEECKSSYGVEPRPHWITTYYGGKSIKKVLSQFGSNIIFSNGLRDPYSSGGILEDISETIVAIKTVNGSHCLDLMRSAESDPIWLKIQRKQELRIIKSWVENYYREIK